MKKYIIYVVISFLYVSCDRLAKNVDPPVIESQLVLNAFLSPEENTVEVEVSLSKPVFGKQRAVQGIDYVTNATVVVTNDAGQSVQLPYDGSLNRYSISQSVYPIEGGRTYTIKVSSDNKTASASCSVPKNIINFTEVSYRSLNAHGSNGSVPSFIYTYKWADEPGVKNYYRTELDNRIIYRYDTIIVDTSENNLCNSVWDASTNDGALMSGSCDDYSYYDGDSTQQIQVYLLNTDIHYYEYHKRRLNYYGDDPFSEPFQQYSNVTGGLGVVCSYRKSGRILLVKP
jgi:hypothetical protein